MAATAQRSFAGGEIAPSLYGRTDMQKYATGLRTCRNMMVQKHGGVANRPGTEFIKEVKDSSKAVRLIRFARNADDTFLLEFGNLYLRFYRLGERVTVSAVPAWSAVTNYVVGDLVSRLGVNYYAVAASLNQQPPNATYWYPLSGSIYEIPTPYVTGDLPTLQFAQSIDTITIVHPSYVPRELIRIGTTNWTLEPIAFAPDIATPQNFFVPPSGGGTGDELSWAITAIKEETYEESLPLQSANFSNHVPSEATPTTISWDAVVGARGYNIYRSHDFGNSYGWIGTSNTNTFRDSGAVPNPVITPPTARDPFNAAGKYPSAVSYYQQRRIFAHSTDSPETIWGSRTAQFKNFTTSFPLQDDDSITFTLVGKQVNAVQHLRDLGRLVVFTAGEEKMVEGDEAGILRPDAINPRKLSSNGAGILPPVEIDDSAIYQQARGTIIRDLKPVSADSYEGTDLTVFAAHLFQKYTLVDWDYAQNPNSIVWVARSDGTLLGLTYLREHAVWGWHRHDTDGEVENVCVVPEGSEDKVYIVVRRSINGSVKRYLERLATRTFSDETRAIFMDSAYPSDLPSANVAVAWSVVLTGGVNWDELELLTATQTLGVPFSAGDVGNSLFITAADGTEVEFRLENFVSPTVMTGHVNKTVPADLRGTVTAAVIKGTLVMTGLGHLEGKSVSVYADGYVVASPNNSDPIAGYPLLTVTGGQITLPRPYKFVRVGLPFISDVVTLDLDLPGSQTIKDRKLLANRLGIYIEASRGIWAGLPDQPTDADPLNGLQEYKARSEEDYIDPVAPKTDFIDINIQARWDQNGRVMVRQVDPLPLTVLSITPIGYL